MSDLDKTKLGAAEILEAAADLLQTTDHCKGSYKQYDASVGRISYCALGAIQEVRGKVSVIQLSVDPSLLDTGTFAAHYLEMAANEAGYVSVPMWNDAPETTADEVIDTMKHVAKELRNGAGSPVGA